MEQSLDLSQIFSACFEKGYESAELYHEESVTLFHRVLGRTRSTRFEEVRAVTITTSCAGMIYHFVALNPTTESVISAIRGRSHYEPITKTPSAVRLDIRPSQEAKVSAQVVNELFLELFPTFDDAYAPKLEYQENRRRYFVASTQGISNEGYEESCGLECEWRSDQSANREWRRTEVWGTEIERFLIDVKSTNPFKKLVAESQKPVAAWPVPEGEIPIVWSARAVSKLTAQFLRAFEGDLVLSKRSFLRNLKLPFPLPFSLFDLPEANTSLCDHEGHVRKQITIFDEGEPRALACDARIAENLSIASTGHCRRQSLFHVPTVAFWNPRLVGNLETSDEITIEWGLSIREIDVMAFDPTTAAIEIEVRDVALVYQGQEADTVEGFRWKINLLDLMKSFCAFSQSSTPTGIPLKKKDQRLIVEITAPRAISRPLTIPGTVPKTHYW